MLTPGDIPVVNAVGVPVYAPPPAGPAPTGSLAAWTITVVGSTGKTTDGAVNTPFVMNGAAPGPFGSNTFIMNFHAPTEWQVI